MATYKVLQDVEAEDKLIGPLTFRQFIYAGIAALSGYLTYLVIAKGAPYMAVFFLPITAAAGFFAWPWSGEQPTEVWALAKIRFLVKPRKRIWNQSGIKELVTITVPKHIDINYTNGLSQNEVHNRLRALADTIDSRGWAVKNSNVNLFTQPTLVMAEPTSDRLLGPSTLPQAVETADVQASDDMMDEMNNPRARQVGNMVDASTKAHRQRIIDTLQAPEPEPLPAPKPAAAPAAPAPPPNNYWFMNQPSPSSRVPDNMVTFNTQVVTPGAVQPAAPAAVPTAAPAPALDEAQVLKELETRKQELPMASYYGHLHTIQPISAGGGTQAHAAPTAHAQRPNAQAIPAAAPVAQAAGMPQPISAPAPAQAAVPQQPQAQAQPPVTPKQQAAILQLANNDDFNVATIAREAQRSGEQNEVVIKLH
ncbi:MAG TPA: PrgI family protein [Patescibacteria group bacterium]|nr:PrgI family protein [Patescibacteria group bacterium]